MKPPSKYIRTKSDELAIDDGCIWDQSKGDRVCAFLDTHLTLDTGKQFTTLEWMRDFINSVYCWIKPNGLRRIKTAFLTLGRKNGKTELASGLCGYHLLADGELSPACISCAVDREQAAQVFEKLRWSVQNNSKLNEVLILTACRKEISYPAKNGKYKSVSSDAPGKFGHRSTFCLYDELAFHKNDNLYTALLNSGDAVPNSLQMIISTAGFNKNGVYHSLYSYAKKVLSGEVLDTGFMPVIYETSEGADLNQPDTWRQANPSLGVILSEDDFKSQWERAKQETASKMDFIRLKFNSWTESETTWLPVEKWELCKGTFPDLTGAPVHIGIDAAHTQDLFAISLVFLIDQKYYIKSFGFVPEAALIREKQNTQHYERFAAEKSLTIVKGNCIDVEGDIYPVIDNLIKQHEVKSITVDPWQLLTLSQHYMNRGIDVKTMRPFPNQFNEPTQAIERAVMNRTLVHDGSSLLRWQVGHCELKRDSKGYVMPEKKTESNKIDNLIALCHAFSQTIQAVEPVEESIYNTRPVFRF